MRLPDRLRRGLAFAACLGLLAASASAPSASPAAAAIAEIVDRVLAVLNDSKLDAAARRERIEKIAYDSFDFDTMSRLVIARYWQEFTPEQKKQFVTEFKALLSSTYGDRIERYNQEKVLIVGERPETRGDVTVLTRIEGGEFTGAEVDYRLREISGAWRIIDVKVEGISLVLNYRDQFKSLLSRGGAENLLEKLHKKNSEI
jgi:phospholipid transport system substrate-binding protein